MSETEDDTIIPLIDRDTPLIDRIRDRRNGGVRKKIKDIREERGPLKNDDSEDSAEEFADVIVSSMSFEDIEEKQEFVANFTNSFGRHLSEKLNVEPESINKQYLEEVMAVMFVDEEEVLGERSEEVEEAAEQEDTDEEGEESLFDDSGDGDSDDEEA